MLLGGSRVVLHAPPHAQKMLPSHGDWPDHFPNRCWADWHWDQGVFTFLCLTAFCQTGQSSKALLLWCMCGDLAVPAAACCMSYLASLNANALLCGGLRLFCGGVQAWGGGSVCQEYAEGLPPVQIDCRLPDATGAFTVNGTCFAPAETSYCTGNGEVQLRFGSPEYVGLGALVFLLLVLLETFGSPFMRNCEVRNVHNESQPGSCTSIRMLCIL